MNTSYTPLACSRLALDYQRNWARGLRNELVEGAPYAFANADTPMEIFHLLGMPVVVNQWWSSVISAKQLSSYYLDYAEEIGFHQGLAKYSALPLFAEMNGDPKQQPWGGLPTPSILLARQSADDHQRIFQHWARLTGAPLTLLSAPAPQKNLPDWWQRARDDWEVFYGGARLDLMQAQIRDLIARVEKLTGRRFDEAAFADYMQRIEQQELIYEDTSRMIAEADQYPVRITEQIPNVMIPQWHRGSDWSINHAKTFRKEVAERIDQGSAVCDNEQIRMMWVGAGLWFDTSFYSAFEQEFGAVFAWSMYLPFAADGYIRHNKGDPLRALAARFVSMNEQLHQPPWANDWLVKQARDYKIDMAVMLVPDNDRPSGHGTRFIAHDLRAAGVEVVEISADMVDARKWDSQSAKSAVEAGIRSVLSQKTTVDQK